MSFNLIESIRTLLSNDMLGKVAGMLGENPGNVQQAMNGIIPSIMTGVLHKAGSGEAHDVLNLAVDAAGGGVLENPGSLTSGTEGTVSRGADMLKNLFGDKVSGLANAISGFSGVSNKSASTLLNMAAPAALGVLGKQITDSNLNAGELLSFLNSQKDNILHALPSGLNLGAVLGLASLSGIAGKLSHAASGLTEDAQNTAAAHVSGAATAKAATGSRWLLPLLLILVLIGIIWYFMNRRNPESATPVMADTVAVSKDTMAEMPAGPAEIKVKLPDGAELNAYKGGIEDQLVNFLNDPNSKPGKDVWFDFDKLNFNTGSADITSGSIDQVQNIGAILKAYPKLKIKIGGYTDRTGDSIKNKKLSQERAASVAAAIKGAGGKASQIVGAEGYGSAFAKAPADAPDSDKMKDRHISISVRAK